MTKQTKKPKVINKNKVSVLMMSVAVLIAIVGLVSLSLALKKSQSIYVDARIIKQPIKKLPATLTISPDPAPEYSQVMATGEGFVEGVPVASIIIYPDGSSWYVYSTWQDKVRFTFDTRMAGTTKIDSYQQTKGKNQRLMSSMTFEVE